MLFSLYLRKTSNMTGVNFQFIFLCVSCSKALHTPQNLMYRFCMIFEHHKTNKFKGFCYLCVGNKALELKYSKKVGRNDGFFRLMRYVPFATLFMDVPYPL